MVDSSPTVGEVPSGATMQPRYMGRIMNTYPVSEPEMDHISELNAQATIRYSISSLCLGLASSIWTNAMFVAEFTPVGQFASTYIAPFFSILAVSFLVGGYVAQRNRKNEWAKIKADSSPLQAFATTVENVT